MKNNLSIKSLRLTVLLLVCFVLPLCANAQDTYYIDGYHGGVWGHYPDWNTRFIVDMLKKHPYWNINLEIEPETWDRAARVDPAAYREFKSMISTRRVEYVNPSYAQGYLFNIDGESIIRQFTYGMKMLRADFPGITFTSYSSEEPCFTSALPQILTSFGIKYASLKNPNTCFGGYTRAHGGELVSWEEPDGSRILTVPRYENESLSKGSTWQTIAWNNSPKYIRSSFKQGITHPVGMTLQDAGWKGGPFLGDGNGPATKNKYVTWRQYFDLVKADPRPVWEAGQEDILVSLVWGSQVTQRIAQQVRAAENKLIGAEKTIALLNLCQPRPWPQAKLDSAWRTLLLSQHHDCWIVPYNGKPGNTWADKVLSWTNNTNSITDSLINSIINRDKDDPIAKDQDLQVTVYNTQLHRRIEPVEAKVPDAVENKGLSIVDGTGQKIPVQVVLDSANHKKIVFQADVPGFGFSKFRIVSQDAPSVTGGAKAARLQNGDCRLETDLFRLVISQAGGGHIISLYDKQLKKEFVDQHDTIGFNSLRGIFYLDGGLKKSDQSPATVKIIENGPVRVKVQISGIINNTPWTQIIALTEHQRIIDVDLNINWQHNVGIGEDTPPRTYDWKSYHKAFYNDTKKLLAVFPLNLKGQKIYKNAPFDVTESRLKNTFFTSWDSIKNNVLLNWVDVTDSKDQNGLALFSDHTTAYVHGENFPLGLVVQYSGMGLWGRNYTINGPTHIHYALMPHKGKWDHAKIWSASADWNQPLVAWPADINPGVESKPMISSVSDGLVLSYARVDHDDLTLRVFNAEGKNGPKSIKPNFRYDKAILKTLDGVRLEEFPFNERGVMLNIPRFGLRTLEFTRVHKSVRKH